METQAANAKVVANFLKDHSAIKTVHYMGFLDDRAPEQLAIFKKQCKSAGAMISFEVNGGEKEAFNVLNALRLIKLAVSLGSTESLVQHPATMTHAGLLPEDKIRMGINENLIRLSVGVENPKDLIWDLDQALNTIKTPCINLDLEPSLIPNN
jgi:methionine-gamma-lyase